MFEYYQLEFILFILKYMSVYLVTFPFIYHQVIPHIFSKNYLKLFFPFFSVGLWTLEPSWWKSIGWDLLFPVLTLMELVPKSEVNAFPPYCLNRFIERLCILKFTHCECKVQLFLGKIELCNHHHNPALEHFLQSIKLPPACFHSICVPTPSIRKSVIYSVSLWIALSGNVILIESSSMYFAVSGFFHSAQCFWGSSIMQYISVLFSSVLLSNIPLYGYVTFSLKVFELFPVWATIVICKAFCEYVFLLLLGICLGMELLSQMVTMFNQTFFSQNIFSQIFFQRICIILYSRSECMIPIFSHICSTC